MVKKMWRKDRVESVYRKDGRTQIWRRRAKGKGCTKKFVENMAAGAMLGDYHGTGSNFSARHRCVTPLYCIPIWILHRSEAGNPSGVQERFLWYKEGAPPEQKEPHLPK